MCPKLSIIVPAYNVEPYLTSCIKSIMSNTFQDFEVLLVDDGSTDRTGALCDELAEYYHNISVFHTPNRGLAMARNLGLDHAEGELIGFVDSDDLISPHMFQILVDALTSQDLQMAMCRFIRCNEEDEIDSTSVSHAVSTVDNQDELSQKVVIGGYGQYVWNKLYRRDIIETYHIRFPKDCKAIEDIYFTMEYIRHCSKVAVTNAPLYCYIMHDSSIMNTFRNSRIVADDYVNLPRGWKFCSQVISEIAPNLLPEAEARTAMFYQTVLRKLAHPSPEYIAEAVEYTRRHRPALAHFKWGWKYYCSALLLNISYPIWARIFRRSIES